MLRHEDALDRGRQRLARRRLIRLQQRGHVSTRQRGLDRDVPLSQRAGADGGQDLRQPLDRRLLGAGGRVPRPRPAVARFAPERAGLFVPLRLDAVGHPRRVHRPVGIDLVNDVLSALRRPFHEHLRGGRVLRREREGLVQHLQEHGPAPLVELEVEPGGLGDQGPGLLIGHGLPELPLVRRLRVGRDDLLVVGQKVRARPGRTNRRDLFGVGHQLPREDQPVGNGIELLVLQLRPLERRVLLAPVLALRQRRDERLRRLGRGHRVQPILDPERLRLVGPLAALHVVIDRALEQLLRPANVRTLAGDHRGSAQRVDLRLVVRHLRDAGPPDASGRVALDSVGREAVSRSRQRELVDCARLGPDGLVIEDDLDVVGLGGLVEVRPPRGVDRVGLPVGFGAGVDPELLAPAIGPLRFGVARRLVAQGLLEDALSAGHERLDRVPGLFLQRRELRGHRRQMKLAERLSQRIQLLARQPVVRLAPAGLAQQRPDVGGQRLSVFASRPASGPGGQGQRLVGPLLLRDQRLVVREEGVPQRGLLLKDPHERLHGRRQILSDLPSLLGLLLDRLEVLVVVRALDELAAVPVEQHVALRRLRDVGRQSVLFLQPPPVGGVARELAGGAATVRGPRESVGGAVADRARAHPAAVVAGLLGSRHAGRPRGGLRPVGDVADAGVDPGPVHGRVVEHGPPVVGLVPQPRVVDALHDDERRGRVVQPPRQLERAGVELRPLLRRDRRVVQSTDQANELLVLVAAILAVVPAVLLPLNRFRLGPRGRGRHGAPRRHLPRPQRSHGRRGHAIGLRLPRAARRLDLVAPGRGRRGLGRVRQLVGQQLPAGRRARIVLPRGEVDVVTFRERPGVEQPRGFGRVRVGVQPDIPRAAPRGLGHRVHYRSRRLPTVARALQGPGQGLRPLLVLQIGDGRGGRAVDRPHGRDRRRTEMRTGNARGPQGRRMTDQAVGRIGGGLLAEVALLPGPSHGWYVR